MFYLTVNYRSHAGIINCAQTVVDLLTMWPESIDRLDPDPGWRKGPKPKIVRRSGFQELFRFVSKDSIDVKYVTSQFPEPYPLTSFDIIDLSLARSNVSISGACQLGSIYSCSAWITRHHRPQ